MTSDDVNNFEVGRRIPHCSYELQLLPGKTIQRLLHKVDLNGVPSPKSFYIRYPQPEGKVANFFANNFMQNATQKTNYMISQRLQLVHHNLLILNNRELHHLLLRLVSDIISTLAMNYFIQSLYSDITHVLDVMNALKTVNKWLFLGLQLGLLYPTLKSIETNERNIAEKCKTEMIAAWLNQQDNVTKIGTPSWPVLQKALREIGENEAASQIDMRLSTKEA